MCRETRHQVAGLPRVQLRASDPEISHALAHLRQVVPHPGGEVVEGSGTQVSAKIRPDLAARSVDRVHLTQPLVPKTREPANGSCVGLKRDWAKAAWKPQGSRKDTVRTIHFMALAFRRTYFSGSI